MSIMLKIMKTAGTEEIPIENGTRKKPHISEWLEVLFLLNNIPVPQLSLCESSENIPLH